MLKQLPITDCEQCPNCKKWITTKLCDCRSEFEIKKYFDLERKAVEELKKESYVLENLN